MPHDVNQATTITNNDNERQKLDIKCCTRCDLQ